MWRFSIVGIVLVLLLSGWDFSKHSIPLNEILSGGPPKDGIPALNAPKFISAKTASKSFLKNSDRVLGLFINGKAKAYPVNILNWHEVVNDEISGKPVLVSYCPLCGTGMMFSVGRGPNRKTFGVSGLLYQSDMLLYDKATNSLWSQIKSEAVAGTLTGQKLTLLASTHTSWQDWKGRHPGTMVLSPDTGYPRDYTRNPYAGYKDSPALFFPVKRKSNVHSPKETVMGVVVDGVSKAYAFGELGKTTGVVKDKIGKQDVTVFYDLKNQFATVRDSEGRVLPSVTGFWFAWYAFHPDTLVFTKNKN